MIDGKKIFGAFAVAVALFFFWPAIVGSWQEVSVMRRALGERQDLLTKRQEILATIATAYREYSSRLASPDGQKFSALVPLHQNEAEIISALQDIATSAGVVLSQVGISPGTNTDATAYKTVSLNLELSGPYEAMRTFLVNVESYVRLLNVTSVDISQATGGALKFVVKADAYFLK